MGKFKNFIEEYMNEAIGDFSQAGERIGDVVSGIKTGSEVIGTSLKNMINKLSTLRETHKKLIDKIEELRSKKSRIENQIEKKNYSKQIKILETQAAKMQENIDKLTIEKEKEVQKEFEKRKRARETAKRYREKKKIERGIKPKEKKIGEKSRKEKSIDKSAVEKVEKVEKPKTEKEAGKSQSEQYEKNIEFLRSEEEEWRKRKNNMLEKFKATKKAVYNETAKKIQQHILDIDERIGALQTKIDLIKMHMKALRKG